MPSYGAPLGPRPGAAKRAAKLNTSGLGRSLVKDNKTQRSAPGQSNRYTTDTEQPGWVKLQSKTQERPLDEFLSTAELADTDFTTERTANIRIIQSGGQVVEDPHVLSEEQRQELVQRHYDNAGRLTVPRRPHWTKDMTAHELDRLERDAFLGWRRSLADLQENHDLLLTPFERNIEVWRQLWRVVERSDLVVQIVDGRNPLLYRSVDLDNYVKEISERKRTLLLVNKADMLSEDQREAWAEYFTANNIEFTYFSAKQSLTEQEAAPKPAADDSSDDEEYDSDDVAEDSKGEATESIKPVTEAQPAPEPVQTCTTRVLSVNQLEQLFIASAPEPIDGKQLQIGLVGYPNVGKSSTINALIGAKKVSVSSTPGKTKHFQTIQLSPEVMLCDCPGLVFPNFAQTNGDLVINGVLPIDQLREYVGPTELVAQRVPKYFLEAVYGIHIYTKPADEGGSGVPTAIELLNSYARARSYWRTGGGDPDISRAARAILKDYVNGKLLYCEPPPTYTGREFNTGKYSLANLGEQRRAQILDAIRAAHPDSQLSADDVDLAREMESLKFSSFDSTNSANARQARTRQEPESAGSELDRDFFLGGAGTGTAHLPFHLQKAQAASTKKHNKGRGKRA